MQTLKSNPFGMTWLRGTGLAFACAFVCCVSTENASWSATFESAHFRVYYEERYYSLPEIERFAARKERLLDYVNEQLGTSFAGIIEVRCTGSDGAYVRGDDEWRAYEDRGYLLRDDGHEIAHIVSFESWGYSRNKFAVEGVAMMAELNLESANCIERLIAYRQSRDSTCLTCATSSYSIADQLMEKRWDATLDSYLQAGAFFTYLKALGGTDGIRRFYQATIGMTGYALADSFHTIYGVNLYDAQDAFVSAYLTH